jgi:hypothetical protein
MIINAGTVLLTLALVGIGAYIGLKFVRAFALQIARENHDALLEMDRNEEARKLRQKQRDADAAAESAFAKVRPILTSANVSSSSASAAGAASSARNSPSTIPAPSQPQPIPDLATAASV